MPLQYEVSPSGSEPLRQCELLCDVWEHRPLLAAGATDDAQAVEVSSIRHDLCVVMSADCDLEWDHVARFGAPPFDESHRSAIPHVLLCDAYEHADIRPRFEGQRDIWDTIRRNQNLRYHKLESAEISGPDDVAPDLYCDFKKTFGVPTTHLYDAITSGAVSRVAVVAPIYSHDIVHRYYHYHSRVGLPT